MSDAPTDPAPIDDESALGLGWLFDAPGPDEEQGNPAIWPTGAVDMLPLPGFALDEDSVLVPLPSAAGDEEPEPERPGLAVDASRAPGGRIRLALRSRAGAGAGVLGSMILVAAAAAVGIGLPSGGGADGGQPATSAPRDRPPALAVDTSWTADLEHAVKVSQRRQERQDAARRRSTARRDDAREKHRQEAPARASAPAPTPVSSSTVRAASPTTDPWAGVPGAVREFEPGPWNDGGTTS
ncbi:hypothetical protein [Miltoncostaea marina]|uniref:hypothetical protein n=1 Tax=Miltoncostaea marina TaxID=2843215 RepID=UPI001C3C5987|nr:hypothetical protein [Miltoncostaea marina]